MARREMVICDVCGKQKQDGNHWFVVEQRQPDSKHGFMLAVWDSSSERQFDFDLCGEGCVLKKAGELIGGKA